jgi:hypothetical protein
MRMRRRWLSGKARQHRQALVYVLLHVLGRLLMALASSLLGHGRGELEDLLPARGSEDRSQV